MRTSTQATSTNCLLNWGEYIRLINADWLIGSPYYRSAALAGAEGTALATKYGVCLVPFPSFRSRMLTCSLLKQPEEYEKLKQHFNNHAAEHDDIEALPTNYNPGYN